MRALITGGAGFLGSHLARRLVQQGDVVTILDNLSTGRLENIADILHTGAARFELGTVTDSGVVERCVASTDRVYHLAGTVGVKRVMDELVTTIRDIVMGTEVVLDACVHHRSPVFLASTSEVYGRSLDMGVAAGMTLSEDDYLVLGSPTNHRWAYAAGKLLDEFLALGHAKESDLRVTIGRLFNTVGPGQTGQYGMVIPRFVEAALARRPITIYGDGHQRRTFLHVLDAIDAIVRLMDTESAVGRVFNIGHSREISILDLAGLVNRTLGNNAGVEFETYDSAYGPGFEDMTRRSANTARLNQSISWAPTMEIEDIILDVAATLEDGPDQGILTLADGS